ncbi:PqqD family protein [Dyadobacter sandarakinus]|uniref:PqqD family protein n=1 Tax=Dyadobacter sandarakinus TaxID=2747268 RepID=A0ABX7I7G7_9BACT|nr:PqqD family protein [Dyadobacter sandarakinus]QRR01735.1 PqqD family protein [Dyadobacter sandarakinus]
MKYELTEDQISSKVGEDTVILNHNKGAYYGLNQVGLVVWDTLEQGPQTVDELCDAVISEYEVDELTCRRDVDALLKDLVSEKLVRVIKE